MEETKKSETLQEIQTKVPKIEKVEKSYSKKKFNLMIYTSYFNKLNEMTEEFDWITPKK